MQEEYSDVLCCICGALCWLVLHSLDLGKYNFITVTTHGPRIVWMDTLHLNTDEIHTQIHLYMSEHIPPLPTHQACNINKPYVPSIKQSLSPTSNILTLQIV